MESNGLLSVKDIPDLKGKYVLVRGSLNVPVKDGVVANSFRLMRGLTTLDFLTKAGAKVVLCGHISNNKETEKDESLAPVFEVLKNYLDIKMSGEVATPISLSLRDELEEGQVLLLENLRQDPREKKNDADFARALSDFAEVYVCDAFSVGHREHASMVGVSRFIPSYAGLNFLHEYNELSKALKPQKPALFMLGGAKFDTKMPLIEKFVELYDHVFIGGALANDFFKAKEFEVGGSLVSDIDHTTLKSLLENKKILLPIDVTVMGDGSMRDCLPDQVEKGESILDVGSATVQMLKNHIGAAQTILWNGPFGNYEKGFDKQTKETAKLVADTKAYSVIGGGDTVAAIEELNVEEKFDFLSTAGGAMLAFLEAGTLPVIKAIEVSQND